MQPFVYVGQPCRVVFGPGKSATLADEITALGAARALFCCAPGRATAVTAFAGKFGALNAGVCDLARPFTPMEAVADARRMALALGADCLVSYGGGNAVGLAKAIALELDVPIIAIATTYSGSETTALQAIRENDRRVNYRSPRMMPRTVIYDPELTLNLPLSITIPSGIHSMAHGVGAFFARDRNPVACLLAEDGIRAMASALARLATDPRDVDARGDALYGAWLCGSTLMSSGTVLHHKVCHVLAGDFGLTHAETHTIVLPHSTAYNKSSVPEAMRRIARAFGDERNDAPGAIFDLLTKCDAPIALRDIGMKREDLDRAADLIMTAPYYNPRPYERAAIRTLLENAWLGRRPDT